MKKIIKSSALFLGACFFAGALHAQLSSDKPALTAQQMTDLIQKRNADAKSTTVTNTVSVSSDKPALTAQQMNDLMQKRNADAKTTATAPVTVSSDKTAPATTSSLPAVSNQGGVKPVTTEPATEKKAQLPSTQSVKPVGSGQQ